MLKVYGVLATWNIEGYAIQKLQNGYEILVTECDYEELIGDKLFLINANITNKVEETEEIAITEA